MISPLGLPGSIFHLVTLFLIFFYFNGMNTIFELCGEAVMRQCCAVVHAQIWVSFLFHCVIRWPVLCHYGAQAWVEAVGEQGSALSLTLKDPPPHFLFCLSVHLSVSVYLSVFLSVLSLSHSLFHTSTFRANAEMQILSPGSGLKCYAMPLSSCSLVSSC